MIYLFHFDLYDFSVQFLIVAANKKQAVKELRKHINQNWTEKDQISKIRLAIKSEAYGIIVVKDVVTEKLVSIR